MLLSFLFACKAPLVEGIISAQEVEYPPQWHVLCYHGREILYNDTVKKLNTYSGSSNIEFIDPETERWVVITNATCILSKL